MVDINVADTEVAEAPYEKLEVDRSESDWFECWLEDEGALSLCFKLIHISDYHDRFPLLLGADERGVGGAGSLSLGRSSSGVRGKPRFLMTRRPMLRAARAAFRRFRLQGITSCTR